MDTEIIRRYENGKLKHFVLRFGDGYRWYNGSVRLVGEETTVIETIRGEEVCIRNCDLVRIEDYIPPSEEGA